MSDIKNKGGRPTLYSENMLNEVFAYLSRLNHDELPTMAGLALHLGVSKDTLNEWEKVHSEFSVALKRVMLKQEVKLINDGIYGGKEVNATIVKLLLQNNHGMREKQDVTTDGKQMPTPIYGGKSIEE